MPKKSSSKVTITKAESEVQQEKPATPSKKADEIDDIFSTRKRKKPGQEKVERAGEGDDKTKKTKKKKRKTPKESEIVEQDSRPRRRTNDGLVIYTEEELGVSRQNAGDTALCPFDCSCCF